MKCENCRTKDGTLCKECAGERDYYIVSEPLAYISNYMKTCSAMMLRMAVLTFYQEDVIHEAKIKLMKLVDAFNFDLRDIKETRQNTSSRTAREKEFEDIMSIMKMIDESEDFEVRFFAEDLTKVPPSASESAGSMLSILEAMSKQNSRLDELQNTIIEMRNEIESNKRTIRRLEEKPQSGVFSSTSKQTSNTSVNTKTRGNLYNEVLKSSIPAVQVQGDTSEVDSDVNSEADGFTKVMGRNAKRKQLQDLRKSEKPKAKPKQGTAGLSDLLCAGPETVFIQLTNVKPTVKDEDIVKYIQTKSEGSAKEVSLKDTSSEGWSTKRFLVEFKAENQELVTGDDFWPGTIYFKRWYPMKPRREGFKPNT